MYEEQVAAGVAFLDERVPDWHALVNVSLLDMRYSHLCVLGQATGGYFLALSALKIRGREVELGFDLPDDGLEIDSKERLEEWDNLTEQWKTAILATST